jgi:hypothetical protein
MPFALAAALALPGCGSTIKQSFRVDEVIGFSNAPAEIGCDSEDNGGNIGSLKPINLNCFKFPSGSKDKTAYELALGCAQSAAAGGGAAAEKVCVFYRNELQAIVMRRANAICDQHKGDIIAQASIMNIGFGVTAAGTSALGAALSGVQAKTNLAALTSLITGSQAITNQELYQKQFAGALISAIDASRARKKTEIDQKRASPTSDYTIDEALTDVQDYHYRCGFHHGLMQITKAVERQDQTSRAKILDRLDALRTELTKTNAMTGLPAAQQQDLVTGLKKQIADLQMILGAAID